MLKYAGDLRVGDVWTERPQGRAAPIYRAIAITPGLAPTTIRITAACVITGRRRTMDFFLVNRVEVHEERSLRHAENSATAVDQPNAPADAAVHHLAGLRAVRTSSGASYHAIRGASVDQSHLWRDTRVS